MPGPRMDRRTVLRGCAALVGGALVLGACSDDGENALRLRVVEEAYGPEPMQAGDLHVPLLGVGHPVVVLVHGGYWVDGFDRSVMRPLAEELVQLGYAVWNIDYRRVGDPGGGWPGTLQDVGTAVDHLARLEVANGLDLTQVVLIGHSAGSQLAFWAASRTPTGDPASSPPLVRPAALASLSGVLDLVGAATLPDLGRLGDLRRATVDFVGGTPDEVPDRYAEGSPLERLPMGVPQLLLHGTDDEIVPVQLTETYRDAAVASGDQVVATLVEGVDHFDTASANKAWWSAVLNWLPTVVGTPR